MSHSRWEKDCVVSFNGKAGEDTSTSQVTGQGYEVFKLICNALTKNPEIKELFESALVAIKVKGKIDEVMDKVVKDGKDVDIEELKRCAKTIFEDEHIKVSIADCEHKEDVEDKEDSSDKSIKDMLQEISDKLSRE